MRSAFVRGVSRCLNVAGRPLDPLDYSPLAVLKRVDDQLRRLELPEQVAPGPVRNVSPLQSELYSPQRQIRRPTIGPKPSAALNPALRVPAPVTYTARPTPPAELPTMPRPNWYSRGYVIGALGAVCFLLVGLLISIVHLPSLGINGMVNQERLIFADQVTAQEGYVSTVPSGLLAEARDSRSLAEVTFIRTAGSIDQQVSSLVLPSLNSPQRQNAVKEINDAFRSLSLSQPPSGSGRDIFAMLVAVSSQIERSSTSIWLRTFGLGTVTPIDARRLLAADPSAAVHSIGNTLPELRGARVNLILAAPAGNQPSLDIWTKLWRREFMIKLLQACHASSISVIEEQGRGSALTGAAQVPVVTHEVQNPVYPAPTPSTYSARLDTSLLFRPDSDETIAPTKAITKTLSPIINFARSHPGSSVSVVGHAAQFGPAQGALQLSAQRARRVASILTQAGVHNVKATGVGYENLLTSSDPQSALNRTVVVTVRTS